MKKWLTLILVASGTLNAQVQLGKGVQIGGASTVQGPQGMAGPPGSTDINNVTGDLNVPRSTNTQLVNVGGTPSTPSATVAASGSQASAYPSGFQQFSLNATFSGAGWDTGYGGQFGPVNGGWSLQKAQLINYITNTRGIGQANTTFFTKIASGDTAGQYIYVKGIAGLLAGSDEGVTGISAQADEATPYRGTIVATTGTGDITPTFSSATGGEVTPADDTLMLNISKGTITGALSGPSVAFGSTFLQKLPITGITVPLTSAWGTASQHIDPPFTTQDVGTAATLSVTLGAIGGSTPAFAANDLITVAGDSFSEQVRISSVGSVSGGIQSVTLPLRYGNNRFVLFRGGIAGQAISSDAELAVRGNYTSYRALGSLTGSDMIYVVYINSNTATMPLSSISGAAAFSTGDTTGGRSPNFHLYPYAEVVKNTSTTAPTSVLEPNKVPWAAGDVVANSYGPFFGGHMMWIHGSQNTQLNESFGGYALAVDVSGYGIMGNRYYLAHFGNFSRFGKNGLPLYRENGGFAMAPRAIDVEGVTSGMYYNEMPGAPGSGSSAFTFQNLAKNEVTHAPVPGCYSFIYVPSNPDVKWCSTDNSWNYQKLIATTVQSSNFDGNKFTLEDYNFGTKFLLGQFPGTSLPSGYTAAFGGKGYGFGILGYTTGGDDPLFSIGTIDGAQQLYLSTNGNLNISGTVSAKSFISTDASKNGASSYQQAAGGTDVLPVLEAGKSQVYYANGVLTGANGTTSAPIPIVPGAFTGTCASTTTITVVRGIITGCS